MRNLCVAVIAIMALYSSVVFAQVRPAEKGEVQTEVASDDTRTMLDTITVKYQGGLFGYNTKEHGTIRFDDINERLSFYGLDGK